MLFDKSKINNIINHLINMPFYNEGITLPSIKKQKLIFDFQFSKRPSPNLIHLGYIKEYNKYSLYPYPKLNKDYPEISRYNKYFDYFDNNYLMCTNIIKEYSKNNKLFLKLKIDDNLFLILKHIIHDINKYHLSNIYRVIERFVITKYNKTNKMNILVIINKIHEYETINKYYFLLEKIFNNTILKLNNIYLDDNMKNIINSFNQEQEKYNIIYIGTFNKILIDNYFKYKNKLHVTLEEYSSNFKLIFIIYCLKFQKKNGTLNLYNLLILSKVDKQILYLLANYYDKIIINKINMERSIFPAYNINCIGFRGVSKVDLNRLLNNIDKLNNNDIFINNIFNNKININFTNTLAKYNRFILNNVITNIKNIIYLTDFYKTLSKSNKNKIDNILLKKKINNFITFYNKYLNLFY